MTRTVDWEKHRGWEEVYVQYYDTIGNYHWTGVYTGHLVIKYSQQMTAQLWR